MESKEGECWQIRRIGPAASCRRVLNIMKLKLGVNNFGRSQENDFFLDSKVFRNFISRFHASITGLKKEKGQVEFILEEKGVNGTFVNDVRVKESQVLTDGDKITFGHTNCYKIRPGEYSEQPHSEFQFKFEKCVKHTSELATKQGLDSIEYHQTRPHCNHEKHTDPSNFDRSECIDAVEGKPVSHSSCDSTFSQSLGCKIARLKPQQTLIYPLRESDTNHGQNIPDVEKNDMTYRTLSCESSVVEICESTSLNVGQDQLTDSCDVSSSAENVPPHVVSDKNESDSDSPLSTRPDDFSKKVTVMGERKNNCRSKNSKSSTGYDECDGDIADREFKDLLNSHTSKVDTNVSLDSERPPVLIEAAVQNGKTELRHENEEYSTLFSEDSDRELCLKEIQSRVATLLESLNTDEEKGKSSDTKSDSKTRTKRKKAGKRHGVRGKKSRRGSVEEEQLEDGVEWYEEDTCASFDCSKPKDRRVQWVQCDDCDQWFHTVCVGCRYDDVKDSQKEFHCGCV